MILCCHRYLRHTRDLLLVLTTSPAETPAWTEQSHRMLRDEHVTEGGVDLNSLTEL